MLSSNAHSSRSHYLPILNAFRSPESLRVRFLIAALVFSRQNSVPLLNFCRACNPLQISQTTMLDSVWFLYRFSHTYTWKGFSFSLVGHHFEENPRIGNRALVFLNLQAKRDGEMENVDIADRVKLTFNQFLMDAQSRSIDVDALLKGELIVNDAKLSQPAPECLQFHKFY